MKLISRSTAHPYLVMAFLTANLVVLPAGAADLALLAGYQFDSSVEISASSQWPPGNIPAGNPGETVDLDEGTSWAVSLNTDFRNNPNQKIGVFFSQHSTGFDAAAGLANPSMDISMLHFTSSNIYPQSENMSFFLTAGLGAAFYRPDDATLKNVTRFSAQIGVGSLLRLANNVYLETDVRWLPTFFNGDTAIFCSGGCTISINADAFSQFQMNAGVMFRF